MTKAWNKHENTIRDLYKVQGKTLEDTMMIMKTQYGFEASTRAYRSKFKKWGWTKYNKQKQSDPRPTTPYEAPLMTPGPSFEGVSGTRAPAIARAINSPKSSYNVRSPDVGYPPYAVVASCSVRTSSGSTLSTSEYPDHQVNHQHYAQAAQSSFQNPQTLASPPPQRNSGIPRWHGYDQQAQRQQVQQQHMLFRPILPAVHQHGQHQILHTDTGDTLFSSLHALLTPESPASSSMSSYQRINVIMNDINRLRGVGRLNERSFHYAGQYLTAFEFYIQSSAPRDSDGSTASPEEIHEFCRVCALFVQVNADSTRIVPLDFAQNISITLRSREAAELIRSVVLNHQQQFQQQDGGRLTFPPWVSLWISACQEGLGRNSAALNEHLDLLSYWLGSQIDVYRYLKELIPEPSSPEPYATPESSTRQLPAHNLWG